MMKVRQLEPNDMPRVWRMAAAQNRRDSTSYLIPKIFEMDENKPGFGKLVENVPLALAVENHGRVCQAFFCLRTIEVLGVSGGDFQFAAAHIPMMVDALKRKGYDDLHVFMPKQRANEQQIRLLEEYSLTRIDNRLATFFRTM